MLFGSVFMFRDPGLSTPYDQLVREMREYVLLMEELGFDYLWLGEHHLGLEGFGNSPNPLLVAADMASRTKNLRFGFACLVPTLWHPLRLAEDIATLDHLTEGRIEIGFGRGPWPRDTVPFHPNADPRDEATSRQLMRENIEILVKAWTEDVFSHQGENWTLPPPEIPWNTPFAPPDPKATKDGIITKLAVFPKPYQKPHPQLWGTVSSPNSLKQTAELGFNAVTWRPSVLQIREWCEIYASIRSEREGRPFGLGEGWAVQRNTYVADSMEEAKDDAEEAFLSAHGFVSSFHTDVTQSLRFYMNPGEKPTSDMKLDWDFLNERQFLAGPPDHVAEKVHELQEVCGVNHLLTNFPGGGGIPHHKVLRSLELFGTKVMPQFRKESKPTPMAAG